MKDKIAISLLALLLLVNVIYFINSVGESPAEIKKAHDFISTGDKYLARRQWQEAATEYAKAETIFRKRGKDNEAGEMAYLVKQIGIIESLALKKEKEPAPVAKIVPMRPIEPKTLYKPEPSQKAAALKKVINDKIVNIDAYFNLGNTYYSLGRYAEAEEAYKKVLAVQPMDFQAYNGIGNCYNAMGKYANAIAAYQTSINLKINNFNAFNNMGNTYRNMNNNEQALAAYQKALELKPNSADVYYNLGVTHNLLGQKKQAQKMLSKAKMLYEEHNNGAGAQRAARALQNL
ncbi:MAG: tetratricopeptide repeat protein [bacterium]|nr:tetratricopeptide repeat protein [bacterium]MDD5756727.1 tetratricopeptide repeat protein [bacterium]